MGRQSGDSAMASSSIALLQERFKHLERMREKRAEKEMLKLLNESDVRSPSLCLEPRRPSLELEMILRPLRPNLEDSLSLGLNSPHRYVDLQANMVEAPLTSLRPNNGAASSSTSGSFKNFDVDTSLRL